MARGGEDADGRLTGENGHPNAFRLGESMRRQSIETWAKSRLVLGAVAVLILNTACAGSDDALGGWDGVERDSAGITIVENFGTPLWGDEPLWTFHEVLRIGTADGDPDYQFGSISAIGLLSDRRIVVADRLGHHLRYYAADGTYQMTVGTPGEGPGEFGSGFLGLMVAPGDTVVVIDARNGQAHAIAPDGSWQGSFSTLPHDGFRFADFDYDPPEMIATIHAPLASPTAAPGDTMNVILERDIRGAVLDTLGWVPSSQATSVQGDTRLRHYYRGFPDGSLCGGGVWIGRSDEYALTWYARGVRPVRRLTLRRERLALDERDQAMLREWVDEVLKERGVPSGRAAEIRSRIRFEDHYPAFRRLNCGPEGTLLVQRVRPLREIDAAERTLLRTGPTSPRPPGTPEWDVFDRNGRLLGSIVASWDGEWMAARFVRDAATGVWYVYGVERDELDVDHVVGWRIEGRMPADD